MTMTLRFPLQVGIPLGLAAALAATAPAFGDSIAFNCAVPASDRNPPHPYPVGGRTFGFLSEAAGNPLSGGRWSFSVNGREVGSSARAGVRAVKLTFDQRYVYRLTSPRPRTGDMPRLTFTFDGKACEDGRKGTLRIDATGGFVPIRRPPRFVPCSCAID